MKFRIIEGKQKGKIIEILKITPIADWIEGGFCYKIKYAFEGNTFNHTSAIFNKMKLEEIKKSKPNMV